MGIKRDLQEAEYSESILAITLANAGIFCDKNEDKKTRKFWDFNCHFDDCEFLVEIKYDKMAAKTGNICIEIENSRKSEPSGITSTLAQVWVCVLSDSEIYITSVKDLREFIGKEKPVKRIEFGGDKNAKLLIYKKEHILPIFHNIHDMESELLKILLKELINE